MTEHSNYYADVLKGWQTKFWGSKPTAEMFANAHGLGCRPGLQALAVAMSLRPEGVTGSQIQGACGNPQLNKMRGLATDSYLKSEAMTRSPLGHKVYKFALTAKGSKRVESAAKREAALVEAGKATDDGKPAKGGKAKAAKKAAKAPRKAKAKVEPVVTGNEPDGGLTGVDQPDNIEQAVEQQGAA